MDHKKYQSWGFTAHYPNAQLWELRTRYNFEFNTHHLIAKTLVGANYRYEDLTLKHAFLVLILAASFGSLGGCATVEGAGKDIQSAGEAIEEGAEEASN